MPVTRPIARAPFRIESAEGALKVDPRLTRFTEQVRSILNDLANRGQIVKIGVDNWTIVTMPRQVAGADAFDGEVFYDTDTTTLTYKDPGGTLHTLY